MRGGLFEVELYSIHIKPLGPKGVLGHFIKSHFVAGHFIEIYFIDMDML